MGVAVVDPIQIADAVAFALIGLASFTLNENIGKRAYEIVCAAVWTLSFMVIYLSLLPWVGWLPSMAQAAFNATLASHGLTYIAVLSLVWGGLVRFIQKWWAALMKGEIREAAKNFLWAILPAGLFLVGLFFHNFYEVYEIVIVHPPQNHITWQTHDGFELLDGIPSEITPEFLRDHRQYIIEIKPDDNNTISSSVMALFRFPYTVEQVNVEPQGIASFVPVTSPIPMVVNGPNVKIFGRKPNRQYWLGFSVVHNIMHKAGVEKIVTNRIVRVNGRTVLHIAENRILQSLALHIGNNVSANLPRFPVKDSLYSSLAAVKSALPVESGLTILMHVFRESTDECFIGFKFRARSAHLPRETKRAVVERLSQPLQHEPSRFLCHSKRAMNLHAANSVFAVDQHPKCRHPFVHAKSRVFKDRIDFERELLVTSSTEPQFARFDKVIALGTTTWANNLSVRPAKANGVVESAVRIGEVNNGFL
jgi:hypothetical protein